MSLMRLLAAGRSLMGGAEQINRYRLPRTRALPSFGGNSNPFSSTVLPGGGKEPGKAEPAGAAQSSVVTLAQPAPNETLKPSWLARLNPLNSLKRKGESQVCISDVEQRELLLENVRVVRNDLSDSGESAAASARHHRSEPARAISCETKPVFDLDDLPPVPANPEPVESRQAKLF
jgi:hypothetical protein